MKSSTSVIKHNRADNLPVATWSPVEFQPTTSEEADELHRLAEGITEADMWLGYEIEAANAPPLSRASINNDPLQQGEEPMPEAVQALFSKRRSLQKSAVYKPNEIPIEAYNWPIIEKTPEPVEETEGDLALSEEPQIDLEQVQQQAQEILERAHQQAEMEAQKIIATNQIQAEKFVDEARKAADGILQEAKDNEEAITQQAYQRGMQSAHQDAVGLLAAARDVLNAAQAWHEQVLQQSEEDVLDLIRIIAENLFGSGTVIDRETLKLVFLKAMDDSKSLGNLRLRVNPEDVELIGEDWIEQQASLQGFQVEIVATDGIQRGGCFIEGDFGTLDARVEKKLERIFEKIEEIKEMPAEDNVETEEMDSAEIISQATQYASSDTPTNPFEIQIAQPTDEAEMVGLNIEGPLPSPAEIQIAQPTDEAEIAELNTKEPLHSPSEIQIAQPIDESEIGGFTSEEPPIEEIDLNPDAGDS